MKQDFDNIYHEVAPGVYRYLRRLMESRLQAEDILQETFLKLHLQLDAGVRIENPRAWLFQVATNLAKNKKRDEMRSALREERYSAPPQVVDFHSRLDDQQIIRRVLAQLSPRMRQALLLFSEGFSYREIAVIAGIETANVGPLLRRAREAFKQYYEGYRYERERNRPERRRSM
ncbi:MAG TPA: sigma-70 family RNA polymerase sigma factor [Blastocatellia bacterium]|jgi:RNA polymerase sigma-70 factor (ECF subfamily)